MSVEFSNRVQYISKSICQQFGLRIPTPKLIMSLLVLMSGIVQSFVLIT